MNSILRIGIIREGKIPNDTRVPLTPTDCNRIINIYPNIRIQVQSSNDRCISNKEYQDAGIEIVDDISDNDVLLGVKEVPISQLIPNKTYFFFSHTIKKQPYNQPLMSALIQKGIRMIDYETLVDDKGNRLIGFGYYAGVVGAHHALRMHGIRTKSYALPQAKDCKDYEDMMRHYNHINIPNIKVVVTGSGKVAKGAWSVLDDAGISKVNVSQYQSEDAFEEPVYTKATSEYLYLDADGKFDKDDFYKNPEHYQSAFLSFAKTSDILINGIFWNESIPRLFDKEDIQSELFSIKTIADISCDVDGSVPITTKATTIENPVYTIDKETLEEINPFHGNDDQSIDMMTVDNLPNELPRDASKSFSETMCTVIIPELLKTSSSILDNATICMNGSLTKKFAYLQDYTFQEKTTII